MNIIKKNKIINKKIKKTCNIKTNKSCKKTKDTHILKKSLNIFPNIYSREIGVIELTLKDFIYDKTSKKLYINNPYFNDNIGFIIFYAPWCDHCIKLSNSISELALSNLNIFPFGAVNLENIKDGNDHLGVYANITNLPTIKYINRDNKSLENYNFEYNIDNMIFYINTNT